MTTAADHWTLLRSLPGLDQEEREDTEVQIALHFQNPQGHPTPPDYWECALDYFLETDNLNQFVQDSEYWHSWWDFIISAAAFEFNLSALDPDNPSPVLPGRAVRYLAKEGIKGEYYTLTDPASVIASVDFEVHFPEPETARPVLKALFQ